MSLTQQLNNQVIKFVTLGLIGIGALVVPQAAKARECSFGNGYNICYEFVTRRGSLNGWLVDFENNHTKEEMNLVCDGKEVATWESTGGLSQPEAQELAEFFCSL
mgnify:CR=1 FL=1